MKHTIVVALMILAAGAASASPSPLKTGPITAAGPITISIGGGATWTVSATSPTGACSTGSFYSVTSGSNGFYVCDAGAWAAGGGGLTNTAPNDTIMMSDGTNAVSSPLTYDGSANVMVGAFSSPPTNLIVEGAIHGFSTVTADYLFDPAGVSYFDSVVGSGGHASGTDETLCIGWTCGAFPLNGDLDVRTNANVINASAANSSAAYFANTDTVNTGSVARSSWGISVYDIAGRGTGTGSLTNYGIFVHAVNGTAGNYALYADAGDLYLQTGALTVAAGNSALQALTATTIHGTGAAQFGSVAVGTSAMNSVSVTAGEYNLGNMQMFGGSSNTDFYIPSASNQSVNVTASGNGAINLNTNADGITNAGTGGVNIGPGNNSSLLGTVFPGTGQIEDRGTKPTPSGCGTAPNLLGGAYSGHILADTGASSCVLTFVASLHGSPSCVITDEAGAVPAYSYTAGALTFTAIATHSYDFDCRGH